MRKLLITLTGAAIAAAVVVGTAAALAGSPAKASARLSIMHVQKGCHVWSDGQHMAPTMRLALRWGGRLAIVNNDVDMHRLVQTAGPKLALHGATMGMNGRTRIVFAKAGTYRFKTRVMEMEGMSEVQTTGPDNNLRLIVKVS